MWLSILNWFLAILSIGVWVGSYIFYEKEKFMAWFDNKFGKDDPMPPSPKQQNDALNLGEGSTVSFNKDTTSDKEES
ncbi:hypothetical protein CIN_11420 [Commensalibacter intestini A911]|uniref:Uncharacterized protein n=2 Tax=Commensalibacter intestini TaxID=479936 RepID=A0A251ZWX5_9PROT|nr:hypothetical protein [Commensalibacter intestini]EHD13783.1 hypothetical protein CIN_11420 [Commensalibacter intestini A911]OUI79153.1 hypothetical protein HK18_04450 [Commensalibacter intestini]